MKHIFFTFIFFRCCALASAQYSYEFYPRYQEVVQRYFETYADTNSAEDAVLKFEKRPDGWHVCVRAYTTNYPLIKDGLIWSLKSKSFVDMDFIKKKEEEGQSPNFMSFYTNWEKVHYDASPYFGYMGSDWDVIQEYGDAQNLPDTILYGVARAYSSYASNLINDNSGLSDSIHRFKLKDGRNSMNAEQLQKYRYYRHKAIELFKQVNAKDPNFETLVGGIGLKLSHEYVTSFLDMRQYQNDEEALKELPDNVYAEFYISLAKNYLNSCSKNAILFVNGDTDTFTLLYVQAKYHFRTDVTVINTGLMLTQRYINHLCYPFMGTNGLEFVTSAETIVDPNREVIYVQNDSNATWPIKKLLAFVKDDKNTTTFSQGNYHVVNGEKLSAKINGKTILWPLTKKGYMLRDEMMMYDIILNYAKKRPIYFAQTLEAEKFLGLNNYLSLEGLAYRLTNKSKDPLIVDGSVNTSKLFENLTKVFTWQGNQQSQMLDFRFRNNYAVEFGWLAYALIQEKKNVKAKEALDTYFKAFPNTCSPFDNSVIYLMECYYSLGEIDKANDIGKCILINMQQKRIHKASLFDTTSESSLNTKTTSEIIEMADKYNQRLYYKSFIKE